MSGFIAQNPDIGIRLTSGADYLDLIQQRDVDVAISYFHAIRRPGVDVTSLGKERIAALCSAELVDDQQPWREQVAQLTLIESQLSPVTWRDWFAVNGMEMPDRPRQSFDRGALSISAAVNGMGVALESTRLAERELSRGELIELGPSVFKSILREAHFLSVRSNEKHVDRIRRFKKWLHDELKPPRAVARNSGRIGNG